MSENNINESKNKINKKEQLKLLKSQAKKNKKNKKLKQKKLTKEAIELQLQKDEKVKARKEFDRKIKEVKAKYLTAKKKNKILEKEFKKTRPNYKNKSAYEFALIKNRTDRELVLNKLKSEHKTMVEEYNQEFEVSGFKLKKWFFGMGKEFNRTAWSTKKSLLENFIIVATIIIFLALIFFAIDSIAMAIAPSVAPPPAPSNSSVTEGIRSIIGI